MDIVLRATAIYFLLWVVTRGTGKRELSQLSPFDLILLVTLGDLIQQGVTHDDRSITGAALAVLTVAFWVVTFSLISHRSPKARRILEGVPMVVLRDGEPLPAALQLERVSLAELAEAARSQGIDDLRKVRFAVLEPDGGFSFLLDHERQQEPPRTADRRRNAT
jgi:uncharacterized membrane protein YcaP (DUF421 family)